MPSFPVSYTTTARITLTNGTPSAAFLSLKAGVLPTGTEGALPFTTPEVEVPAGGSFTFLLAVTMPGKPGKHEFLLDVYARYPWDVAPALAAKAKGSEGLDITAPVYNFGVSVSW